MVRPPSFDSNGMKKGAWSEDEDIKLKAYITRYGHWNWRLLPKYAGLKRCGKSCRLRWVNYLKPGVKRGSFSKEEQDLVIKLHAQFGNKWSAIAAKLPGRTDNEIKNFWHTRVERRHKPVKKTAVRPTSEEASSINFSHDSDSSEASSLHTSHPQSLPSDDTPLSTNSEDQLDLMLSEVLEAETNYGKLLEEEFDYPELHYSDLSSSGSASYVNNWTADDDDQLISGSFWNEPSPSNASISEFGETSDYPHDTRTQLEEEGLLYYDDPLLQFFDYEGNRFC